MRSEFRLQLGGGKLSEVDRNAGRLQRTTTAERWSTVWLVGVQTSEIQGRLTFVGIAAMACIVALDYERLRLPVPLRLVLPACGVAATFDALHHHAFNVYGV